MSPPPRRRPPAAPPDLSPYLGLVEQVARAVLRRRRLPRDQFLDDAIQSGFEGLSRACDAYDAERGASFEAFARPVVLGAIVDALRREHRHERIKKRLLEGADSAAGGFAEQYEVRDEGLRTPAGAAAAARKGTEGFVAALGLGFLATVHRLDPESALSARRDYARALDVLQALVGKLAEREQLVVRLHSLDGLSWGDVAEHTGRSRATVQRWHARAVEELRKGLAERGITERPRNPDSEEEEEEEEEE